MATRKNAPKSEPIPGSGINKWEKQDSDKKVKLPSGSKLHFHDDECGILMFLGSKDISDKCGKEPGEVIYNVFHDGRRIVNAPMSYAFTEYTFEKGKFYFVHMTGSVEITSRKEGSPLKDFEIAELGEQGETVPCDERLTGSPTITLDLDVIKELNYTKLNYPLRAV